MVASVRRRNSTFTEIERSTRYISGNRRWIAGAWGMAISKEKSKIKFGQPFTFNLQRFRHVQHAGYRGDVGYRSDGFRQPAQIDHRVVARDVFCHGHHHRSSIHAQRWRNTVVGGKIRVQIDHRAGFLNLQL